MEVTQQRRRQVAMEGQVVEDVLVGEIDSLYHALRGRHGPNDLAKTVNHILLYSGVSQEALSAAWDRWFTKLGGIRRDLK